MGGLDTLLSISAHSRPPFLDKHELKHTLVPICICNFDELYCALSNLPKTPCGGCIVPEDGYPYQKRMMHLCLILTFVCVSSYLSGLAMEF